MMSSERDIWDLGLGTVISFLCRHGVVDDI